MKKYAFLALSILAIIITVTAISSCGISSSVMSFGEYENAEQYSIGSISFSKGDIKKIDIDWISGGVSVVQQSSGEQFTVSEGIGLDDEKAMRCLIEDGVLYIKFSSSGFSGAFSHEDIVKKTLKVTVPADIEINVKVISADTEVSSDGLSIADGVKNTIEISSVSGDISIEKASAESIRAKSVSGDIIIKDSSARIISEENTSGGVSFYGKADLIKINTISSNSTVSLDNTSATVVFETTSGILRTGLDYVENSGKYIFGNGETLVTVKTVSGNLFVK